MPPKKKSTELIVLLVDVNSSANTTSPSNFGFTDFNVGASIADSILCRKIFSESRDLCSLICYGFKSTRPNGGFHVVSDGFELPQFFTLEKFDEIKPGTESPISVQQAIEYAIKQIEKQKDDNPRTDFNSTIFLLSNLDSTPSAMLTEESAKALAEKLVDQQIELFVASPDSVINDTKSPKIKFMGQLMAVAGAQWLSFSECKTKFGTFIPKQTGIRGMPFDLKLDENINIKLQLYKKISKAKVEHKFVFCKEDGTEAMKKHFQHSTRPDITIGMKDVDKITDEEFISGKIEQMEQGKRIVNKEDLVKAYYYGKTVVPIDDSIKEEFKPEKLGKELKLIQFTSRDNILPQFLMGEPRYLLPVKDAYGSQRVFQDLIKDLLNKNLVAIVRYAYNKIATPRIVCLIPKIKKNGLPMFIQYQLPQGDDVRPYEFKRLDIEKFTPSDYEKDTIETFVDTMMLEDNAFTPKNVPNAQIQQECSILRSKALDPSEPITKYQFAKSITQTMSMPESEEKLEAARLVSEAFKLEINQQVRPRDFGNRPLGVEPLEFKEYAEKKEEPETKMEI